MSDVLISLKDITKTFTVNKKPFEALKGITLDIFKGEIVSLLGVNGAGKTTLSSIIATVHPPTAGDITWQGLSIYKSLDAYRSIIGLCPQRQNFDPLLTVRENLIFAGRYYGLSSAVVTTRVNELIEQFNLEAYVDESVTVLSGGYRQRLLIARALIHNPALVILDEPTIALDPHIRRGLWDTIKELKDSGITVIFTTHYLDEAEILSDRVCIIDKGRLRLTDTPANLLTSYNKRRLEDVFLALMEEKNGQ